MLDKHNIAYEMQTQRKAERKIKRINKLREIGLSVLCFTILYGVYLLFSFAFQSN